MQGTEKIKESPQVKDCDFVQLNIVRKETEKTFVKRLTKLTFIF